MSDLDNILVDETLYATTLTAKYKNRKPWTPRDSRKLTAFLPGTVTQIFVSKGEKVEEGQIVIKFEAMKMINNVQALVAGTVKELYVKVGDKFSKGTVLMEFEKK